jgi:hypothetical protein
MKNALFWELLYRHVPNYMTLHLILRQYWHSVSKMNFTLPLIHWQSFAAFLRKSNFIIFKPAVPVYVLISVPSYALFFYQMLLIFD